MKVSLNEIVLGVYKIHNRLNDSIYIGSSFNIEKRFKRHYYLLRTNQHNNQHLQRAWNKYGEESFEFTILATCQKEELLKREQYHINLLKPKYNICPIAGSTTNREVTLETRQKISKAFKGENHPFYGKKMPKEWIEKAQATKRASGYKMKIRVDRGIPRHELDKRVLCLNLLNGVYDIYPSIIECERLLNIHKDTLRASLKRAGNLRQFKHLNFSYYED